MWELKYTTKKKKKGFAVTQHKSRAASAESKAMIKGWVLIKEETKAVIGHI